MPYLSRAGVPVYSEDELRAVQVFAIEHPGLPKGDPKAETGVYRSVLSPNEVVKDYPKCKTVVDLFEAGASVDPNANCLGRRVAIFDPETGLVKGWSGYQWESYGQVAKRRLDFGRGLDHLYTRTLKRPASDKWNLGIFSLNRPEWVIADLGAQLFSLATVALYDTLGPETSEFIINHSELPMIVTTLDKVGNVFQVLPICPTLKVIIVMDDNFPALKKAAVAPFKVYEQWAREKGIVLVTFAQVEELGRKHLVEPRRPTADDLLTICYTSGTTGNPKGALLTHGNMVAVKRGGDVQLTLDDKDVHISYLPLAHVFERVMLTGILNNGGSIGFFRGDILLLIEDIQLLQPTLFCSVPRLLNRIYDKINAQVATANSFRQFLFRTALQAKLANLSSKGQLTHAFWDRLVFRKVKAVIGGRVRGIVTASAPISGETLAFLRVVFGCEVLEAYGQTECTGGFSMTLAGDYSKGHVGAPLACAELKLMSVPEMRYLAQDKKGEICIRGPGVFKGYYKDPEKTAETLTADGWLKTGDIGMIDSKGRLYIVDRKKNIFKLSQGEYVAPDKIENTYVKSNFIAQLYVHGDSLQSELVAIVVPEPEFCIQWGKDKGILPSNTPPGINPPPAGQPPHPGLVKLCASPEFRQAVQADMDNHAKGDQLRGFEYVRAIALDPAFFTVENGLLTPTFKLKRSDAAEKFRPLIDALYKELELSAKARGINPKL